MGQVANWGDVITFEVTSDKVLTFSGFKREIAGRWKSHEIINGKPKQEFTGPDSSEITMDVTLSAEHGISPRSTLDTLEAACEGGTVAYLYVGGKKVGSNKLCLESISETWDEIWNKGELVRASATLTFLEYA